MSKPDDADPAAEGREFEPDPEPDDRPHAEQAPPDLTRDVLPTAGNLMPGALPVPPAVGPDSDDEPTGTPEPDPDDPRWER